MKKDFESIHALTLSAKGEKERFCRAVSESSLSAMMMLYKLCQRKIQGKRPFSPEFRSEERMRDLLEGKERITEILLSSHPDFEKMIPDLRKIMEISIDAEKEIKNVSLKGDYLWIKAILESTIASLSNR